MNLTTQSAQKQVTTRPKVLVVGNPDGHIEIYGSRDLDVVYRLMPSVGSVAGEILAERLIEQSLSQPYRDLYYPGNLRATGHIETRTVSDIARQHDSLMLFRAIDQVATEARSRHKCTA